MPGRRSGSVSRPPSPSSTCSRSAGVDTIVKTTSRSRRSAIASATVQPSAVRASALARVRFQTCGFTPARASRTAMAAPIRPAPIQPTERSEEAVESPMSVTFLQSIAPTVFAMLARAVKPLGAASRRFIAIECSLSHHRAMTAELSLPDAVDVVVVGAGHNGLVCASYLAAAGLEVCVLEARDVVGGNTVTEELTLPGFAHDSCSSAHVLIQANPLIADDELGLLATYGLRYEAHGPGRRPAAGRRRPARHAPRRRRPRRPSWPAGTPPTPAPSRP